MASQAFASPAASGASSLEDGGGPSGTPFVVAAAAFTRDAGGVPGAPGPCPAGAPPGAGGAGQRSAQGARQACDQGLGQLQRRAQQGQQGQHDQRQQDDAVDLHRHVVVEIKTANALPLVKYACTGRVIALPTGPINAARVGAAGEPPPPPPGGGDWEPAGRRGLAAALRPSADGAYATASRVLVPRATSSRTPAPVMLAPARA